MNRFLIQMGLGSLRTGKKSKVLMGLSKSEENIMEALEVKCCRRHGVYMSGCFIKHVMTRVLLVPLQAAGTTC